MNQIHTQSNDGGTEDCGYVRSQSDHHLPIVGSKEKMNIKPLPRTTSAAASTFPLTISSDQRVVNSRPIERQTSSTDPISDRVSTVLVWQNLTVSTRENKRREFLQRLQSSKNFVPKRKDLLHNLSGAITGGLWAVMGKSIPFIDYLSIRSFLHT